MDEITNTIELACQELEGGNVVGAKRLIQEQLPFEACSNVGRNYGELQKLVVFVRDGFIDRYSGNRLVFPPVLKVLSNTMPLLFPYHLNWKMSECHIAYWKLSPTLDHIVPVSRGGKDDMSNWVSTSQLRNSAKSNWLLEELDWKLFEPGNLEEWDGMLGWFMRYVQDNRPMLNDHYIEKWHKAALKMMEGNEN